MSRKKNILVLYYTRGVWPLRDTINTHLYCWRNYGRHRVFYVNVAFGYPARLIRQMQVDVVIFHTIYLSMRWSPEIFRQYTELCAPVAAMPCIKIAMPQDEFMHTDLLDGYLDDTGVDHVLTCAEPEDWPTIYPRTMARGARFRTILTGYLDDNSVARIRRLGRTPPERTIDIGYRAWRAQYWLGEHGMMKVRIADVFERAAAAAGMIADISLKDADVLGGDDWFHFLMRCRTTPGVEGGASICDTTGEIKQKVEAYLERHPDASFEETRAACFPDRDGSFGLSCLSPRHLEACVTQTCQVLVRGNYNGLLVADRHYIPIERDWSNLEEVMAKIQDRKLVEAIARRAYEEVVENPLASYRHFVRTIEDEIINRNDAGARVPAPTHGWSGPVAMWLLAMRDRFHWWFIRQEVLVAREQNATMGARVRRLIYAGVLKWLLPRV